MNPSDDENIYGNLTNNNGLNEDSSLSELKDLAVEINDSEINIDINETQIPLENDDLYQFNTTSNNESNIEYHEQLSYENNAEINIDTLNTQNIDINNNDVHIPSNDISFNPNYQEKVEESFSNIDEYTPNDIAASEYNDIPNEEIETGFQDEIIDENNDVMSQINVSYDYNNNEINSENENAYNSINETIIEPQEQQNYIQQDEEEVLQQQQPQEEYNTTTSNYQETAAYSPNYQNGYNQEYEEVAVEKPKPKRNFIPILMAILAIAIFFIVLNSPQVKEKISGFKSNDIEENEQIEKLNELSKLDKPHNQNVDNKTNKRAKMVVFDEEQKDTDSNNVKVCANPFLPTMNVDNENDNSLGAYEIIVPPNGDEIDNSVEVSTMMETKVSGILYDRDNPQAILNYDGQDQLVRRGDRLAGFYVMSITPDKVILKQGNNVYRVSVGQTVTDEGINYNVNSNLGKQFGGRYKNIKGKIINMNNDQEK